MIRRLAIALYLTVFLSIPPSALAHGLEPWMHEILLQASADHDAIYWKLEQTVHCESMHFNPRVIDGRLLGLAGEIGAVQLHPRGRLSDFYARGFHNPRNFSESVNYLALMMSENTQRFMQQHWSCYPR